ncbi:MAG: hypothetical protein AMXMBFR61_26120 [Fimbriimonadales bacterium]
MQSVSRWASFLALVFRGGVGLLLLPLCAHAQIDTSSPWPKWAADNRNTGRAVKSLPSGFAGIRVRWSTRLPFHENPHYRLETVERGIVVGSDG